MSISFIINKSQYVEPNDQPKVIGRYSLSRIFKKGNDIFGTKYCDICRNRITWKNKEANTCINESVVWRERKSTSSCQDWLKEKEQGRIQKANQNFETLLSKGIVK